MGQQVLPLSFLTEAKCGGQEEGDGHSVFWHTTLGRSDDGGRSTCYHSLKTPPNLVLFEFVLYTVWSI